MYVIAEHLAQRRVEEMRRRMIALGVTTTVARHRRAGATKLYFPAHPAQRGDASIDFTDLVDVDAPAFSHDLAVVRDLSARLSVKRCLAQDEGDALVRQVAFGDDHRVDLEGVVAGKDLAVAIFAFPSGGEHVRRDADFFRLTLFLRLRALTLERNLESGDVDRVAALARHQLR